MHEATISSCRIPNVTTNCNHVADLLDISSGLRLLGSVANKANKDRIQMQKTAGGLDPSTDFIVVRKTREKLSNPGNNSPDRQ